MHLFTTRESVTAEEVHESFLYSIASNLFAGVVRPSGFRNAKEMINNNDTKYARFLIEVAVFLGEKVAQFGTCFMFQQLQLSNCEDWPLKNMKDGLKKSINDETKDITKKMVS